MITVLKPVVTPLVAFLIVPVGLKNRDVCILAGAELFIGPTPFVTPATGFRVMAGVHLHLSIGAGDILYGVLVTGNAAPVTVLVVEK